MQSIAGKEREFAEGKGVIRASWGTPFEIELKPGIDSIVENPLINVYDVRECNFPGGAKLLVNVTRDKSARRNSPLELGLLMDGLEGDSQINSLRFRVRLNKKGAGTYDSIRNDAGESQQTDGKIVIWPVRWRSEDNMETDEIYLPKGRVTIECTVYRLIQKLPTVLK